MQCPHCSCTPACICSAQLRLFGKQPKGSTGAAAASSPAACKHFSAAACCCWVCRLSPSVRQASVSCSELRSASLAWPCACTTGALVLHAMAVCLRIVLGAAVVASLMRQAAHRLQRVHVDARRAEQRRHRISQSTQVRCGAPQRGPHRQAVLVLGMLLLPADMPQDATAPAPLLPAPFAQLLLACSLPAGGTPCVSEPACCCCAC